MKLDLVNLGFSPIETPSGLIPDCVYLAKRQTFNTNRAICVIQLSALPRDVGAYLKSVRNKVAFKVGFFPLFWGLGLQVILMCPGATSLEASVSDFVARVDNQWAIIQSVFFVDPIKAEFIEARAWGQFVTAKFQDEISRQLEASYCNVSA